MYWQDDWPLFAWGAGVVVLIGLMILAMVGEAREWEQFAGTHHCKVTGRMRGDTVTTIAPIIGNGGGVAIGVSSTPDKTGYLCDDGVTYWR